MTEPEAEEEEEHMRYQLPEFKLKLSIFLPLLLLLLPLIIVLVHEMLCRLAALKAVGNSAIVLPEVVQEMIPDVAEEEVKEVVQAIPKVCMYVYVHAMERRPYLLTHTLLSPYIFRWSKKVLQRLSRDWLKAKT